MAFIYDNRKTSKTMTLELNKIYNMDCLEGMKELSDASVDLIVTDPPYGLEFMGKDWDKAVPSVQVWKECLRVLKHGSFAFVMSSPRSDVQSQMILRLQEAGFSCGFTPIFWAYASGFPKAMNISKAVDRKLKIESEVIGRAKGMGKQNPEWNGTAQGRSENFYKQPPVRDWRYSLLN